ncbi:MAG: SBBP repeat-containing protein [Terriglobia bacterium]
MRRSVSEKKTGKTGNGMKAAFLAAAVLATAGVVFYFGTAVHSAKTSRPGSAEPRSTEQRSAAHKALASTALSLPLFFEQNQGQTAPQVKFLARGVGYGLFLTADEAVLELQTSAVSTQYSALSSQPSSSSVIRMRLEGANSSARVSGASLLPGKSNYFIGNDPAKWRHDIPQFARVEYRAVYPGVDLVYYGNQGQLEYDFRVAPGADPNQIALSFQGASAHIVSGDSGASGDLILSTDQGDVRFHAPNVYQPATPESGNPSGNAQKTITGSFRQLADNKIGFTIGDYDHSRELVIDPVLSYSTFLGGSNGVEGALIGASPLNLVKVAIDSADWIYVAGSTTSTDFPMPVPPNTNNPIQSQLGGAGAQNIFIAVINPTLQSPTPPNQQLVYATYLGGAQVAGQPPETDSLAGIAVDTSRNIYVAGTTTSTDFPTTSSALPQPGPVSGTHGFLSALTLTSVPVVYNLAYSTYLAGNGTDTVTGLAIDGVQNAYVTGTTTSSNPATTLYPFPASPNGYQTKSNNPGNPQFFASQISTTDSGYQSMLYSTYFGGGYPANATAIGGGIAVDPAPNTSPNMYITGTTTMLGVVQNGAAPFPLFNAQQSCLNESGKTSCTSQTPTTTPDAFVAKINPYQAGSNPVYSTYIGGSGDDYGNAIDVDTSGNAYVTGWTDSTDWACGDCSTAEFQPANGGGQDAFIVKIGNLSGSSYPMTYFTYLGGSSNDIGQDIKVDTVQAVHVVGSTTSTNFPTTINTYQPTLGVGAAQNAFVALISTTLGGTVTSPIGDYSSYLGGNVLDQGTGVAIDPVYGSTYVAGITQSSHFPTTPNAYQSQLNGTQNAQNAFVSKIGNSSTLNVTATTPSPYPAVAAGNQVEFTFDITNSSPSGTDPASQVVFTVQGLPTSGLASAPTAQVNSGLGSCNAVQGSSITCTIPTLAANAEATVQVDVTPSIPVVNSKITISGSVSANGGLVGPSVSQPIVYVVDFAISAATPAPINAGDFVTILVTFTPTPQNGSGYNAVITPSQSTSPSMVTASTPTFAPTTVTLSGTGQATTNLTIYTVPRPVITGSLFRRGSFYAAWLPIGGLSLVGLGIGVGRKRRRWLVGAVLGLIAGIILLQPGCGSSSNSNTPATAGGTLAGEYTITITGSAGTGAVHTYPVTLTVN